MSGFAQHLNKTKAPRDYDKATSERFRVVRFDGVVLGGSPARHVAERQCRVICTGQRADYAVVMVRGGAK